jgi:hypothetical protein
MPQKVKPLIVRKTTWAAAGGLATATAGYLTGTMDAPQAITLAINSVLALALRSAIAHKE